MQSKLLVMTHVKLSNKFKYLVFVFAMIVVCVYDWWAIFRSFIILDYVTEYRAPIIVIFVIILISDLLSKLYTCNIYLEKLLFLGYK